VTSKRSTATTAARGRPPSVERVLAALRTRAALDGSHHGALTSATRVIIDEERARLAEGGSPRTVDALAASVAGRLASFKEVGVEPAINATGVIVHTNLGRAPWPPAVIDALGTIAGEPILLELDRATGKRGGRGRVAEDHLVALTGAQDALVTNNNAAALVLAVGLAGRLPRAAGAMSGGATGPSPTRRRTRSPGVVVSRGALVEIGGGVRIPDIVRRAGARLIEVGTTNRTRAADFEEALADGQADLVLRVHASNFTMAGFTEAPDPAAVAAIAHRYGAIVVDDLGSGALIDTSDHGLAHEPMPDERLAAGADLVTFSGDKLVGGPQAGFIVGRGDLVAQLRRDPLARAMRPDKVTMAAVALTLGLYRAGRATADIPVWRMVTMSHAVLRERAERLSAEVDRATGVAGSARVVDVRSTVGGGSLPGEMLASVGISIGRDGTRRLASRLLRALRAGDPIVIGRIEDERVVLDLRTVEPSRDPELAAAVVQALASEA
jgi:L-seryl-tRNA(Ser) seleniumtransferase